MALPLSPEGSCLCNPCCLSFPQLACECYALLPSLGAGFAQGLKYRESWEQQAHSLVATLHRFLGALYEGAETGEWVRPGGRFPHRPVGRGSRSRSAVAGFPF